jgi:hypothetical protein
MTRDKKGDKPKVRELQSVELPKAKADKMVTVWECVIHEGETLTTTDHRRVTLRSSIVVEVHNDWLEPID